MAYNRKQVQVKGAGRKSGYYKQPTLRCGSKDDHSDNRIEKAWNPGITALRDLGYGEVPLAHLPAKFAHSL